MNAKRIFQLRQSLNEENISLDEILEIQDAFDTLVETGVELRDLPENATASDMLDELACQ